MSAVTARDARFVVLAALDASDAAREVLRVGANVARRAARGELHVVHVVEDLPAPAWFVPRAVELGITADEIVASARARVAELASDARAQFGGVVATHVAAGCAWKQILQAAADVQADLVVVGTHGRTGARRMMLGAVAAKVARMASCPVVVVREKDYHANVPCEIEPACPACLRAQRESHGTSLTCGQHAKNPPHGLVQVLPAPRPGRS